MVLAVVILAFLASGFALLGNYSTPKERFAKELSFQSDVFERQIDKYYEDLTMMGTSLSNDISKITARYLASNSISHLTTSTTAQSTLRDFKKQSLPNFTKNS